MADYVAIGKRIRRYRESLRITQADLAMMIGSSPEELRFIHESIPHLLGAYRNSRSDKTFTSGDN